VSVGPKALRHRARRPCGPCSSARMQRWHSGPALVVRGDHLAALGDLLRHSRPRPKLEACLPLGRLLARMLVSGTGEPRMLTVSHGTSLPPEGAGINLPSTMALALNVQSGSAATQPSRTDIDACHQPTYIVIVSGAGFERSHCGWAIYPSTGVETCLEDTRTAASCRSN